MGVSELVGVHRRREASPSSSRISGRRHDPNVGGRAGRQMSARTGGSIASQIMLDMVKVNGRVDRVLDGPTSEVWIDPWVDDLTAAPRNVTFQPSCKVERHPVRAESSPCHRSPAESLGTTRSTRGRSGPTYYVAAMPVEKLAIADHSSVAHRGAAAGQPRASDHAAG